MTVQVNIAKTTLAEVVDQVQAGEDVILTRDGEPVAEIRGIAPKAGQKAGEPRKLGIWDHLNLNIPDDLFIGPDEETLAAVDGPLFPPDDEAAA